MACLISIIKRWPLPLKLLYLLIVFDGAATYIGLRMGVIEEANPLLAASFNAFPLLTLVLKLGLSLLFLEFLHYAVHVVKIKWTGKVVPGLVFIHTVVAFLHLNWIRLLITYG